MVDAAGREIEPVSRYLRDLALGDASALTGRSYRYDLLRWFRVLWAVDVGWEQATEAETTAMVGWLRTTPNPQRRRSRPESMPAGVGQSEDGQVHVARRVRAQDDRARVDRGARLLRLPPALRPRATDQPGAGEPGP
ncbi:site-specific integrase [Streptomyces eurythermus]|uniref:site-specific integrase n=1 Tax=Streptomyces eurythermus TaxID=42237 RepID=UPI0033F96FBD